MKTYTAMVIPIILTGCGLDADRAMHIIHDRYGAETCAMVRELIEPYCTETTDHDNPSTTP